ncbi:MAG: proprotein convertase P-domain-containing protein [Verrucomicrobiales bacterium]|nr:proprotein convertase P-domain-containing protein [Verrucomicrobiales bacterium]
MSVLLAVPALGQGLSLTPSGKITINDAAFQLGQHIPSAATPYPSTVISSNLLGTLQKATVTFTGLTHGYAADVDALLVRTNAAATNKMVLFSDVALNFPFSGINLTIDATSIGVLPDSGAVASGTYAPKNLDTGADDFKLGLDAGVDGPYTDALSGLAGTSPNATWRLFVVDDKNQDSGEAASWSLNLWTTPVFTKVPATTITTNEDKQISFTVEIDDSDTPADNLKLYVKTSSNPGLIDPTNIVVSATGKVRTVTLSPKQDQSGGATLTLALEDTISKEATAITATVAVQFNAVNDTPTIALSTAAISTTAGRLSTNVVYAKVGDVDNNVDTLTLFARSSNTNLVPADHVFFVRGSNGTNFFAIAPRGAATGTANVDILVTDGTATNSTSLTFTATPIPIAQFGTGNELVIPDDGSAASQTLGVSNIVGNIGTLLVVLGDLNHPRPEDLDLVLVGPGATPKSVALMGQAGGANAVNHARLRFATGEAALPDSGQITDGGLTTASYSPVDYNPSNLPSPAPAGPYGVSLTEFNGTSPNGTWTLWAVDRVSGQAGTIKGGFTLVIYAAPTISNLPLTVTTDEDIATTTTFNVADSDGSVTNVVATVLTNNFATVTVNRNGGAVTLNIAPTADKNGTGDVRVVVTDNNGFSTTNQFALTIRSINDAPVIAPIAKQITYAGIPIEGVSFSINDTKDLNPPENLTVTASSSNSKLLPDSNIIFGPEVGGTRTVSLYPVGSQPGTVTITLTVRDNGSPVASSTTSFVVEVLGPASPLFANTNPVLINDSGVAGGPAASTPSPSSITVSGLVGKIRSLKVTLLGLQHPRPKDLDILLVGPNNHRVMLMSDAGSDVAVQNLQMLFDDTGVVVPELSALSSGTFKPSDYNGSDADTIPGLAAGGTSATTLNSFSSFNITPNGRWDLYIVDDTGNTRGAQLAGGWMINFITGPALTPIPDQTTDEDVDKRVSLVLGDDQPGVATDIQITSDNAALVVTPTPQTAITGSGSARQFVLDVKDDQSGVTTNTVRVTMAGATEEIKFKLTVAAVDDQPIISAITKKTSAAGLVVGPIAFTVSDKETADPSTIEVTAASSNPAIVANTATSLVLGGSAGSRTITVVPNGSVDGTTTITLTAKDDKGQKSTLSFEVEFQRSLSFQNTARIDIRDNATAAPYPATIDVSGISGLISGVQVSIFGFGHTFPDDANLLLVSPNNDKAVLLLANSGGGAPSNSVSGLSFTFSDAAAGTPPDEGKLATGTYRPSGGTVTTVSGSLPAPAPAAPYGSTLAAFKNISPNGQWKLYALDDTFSDAGVIEFGWTLVFNTAPEITQIATQTTREDEALPVLLILQDQDTAPDKLIASAVATNVSLTTSNTILPTNAYTRTLTLYPGKNQNGTNRIDLSVTDGTTTTTSSFQLIVLPVDDTPVATTVTNLVVINEDAGNTDIIFAISDVDSSLNSTNARVRSSNTALVPNVTDNLTITTAAQSYGVDTTNNITVRVKPLADQSGDTQLTFSITDGTTTVENVVTLRVNAVNDTPTIGGLVTSTNVPAGLTLSDIPFTVSDKETSAKNLTVTAKSSDQTRLPNANLVLGGANENRFLSLTTLGTNAASLTVSVIVSDGEKSSTNDIALTITDPPGKTYASGTAITIRDNNTASVYPSTIPVSSLNGAVHSVVVNIEGFTHSAPDDVDILLVGPTGKKVVLMGDAGGSIPVGTPIRLTFDGTATPIPDNGPLEAGKYAPSNYSPDDNFSGVAAPYGSSLSEFVGTNPNGDWKLYVVDDTANDSGAIAQGWSLTIVTAPTLTIAAGTPAPIVQNEDTASTFNITIADQDFPTNPYGDYRLTFVSQNTTLIPGASFVTNSGTIGSGLQATVTVLPGTNQPADSLRATNLLTLTLTRKDGATTSATVTNVIVPQNDAPIITRITQKTTEEDIPISTSFLVTDVDTLPRDLKITATSLNTALISNTNIQFYGQSGASANVVDGLPSSEVVVTLTPNRDAVGTNEIELVVTDKSALAPTQSTTNRFTFAVTDFNDPPTISTIPDISITAGTSSTNIVFTVGDNEGSSINLTATSSDQGLVKDSNIAINIKDGAPGSRTIRVTSEVGVTGRAIITVAAKDGQKTTTTTFTVTIVESRERSYTNNRSIVINDNGPGADYPSIINVSGLVGDVKRVRVAINSFAHRFPQDVDLLLVSPAGKKVLLMSDVGGGSVVTNLNITFDDAASDSINVGGPLASGTYRPSNAEGASDPFGSPAPAGPYATSLSDFIGTAANGDWKLYVMDDTPTDAGVIIGGWTLFVETKHRIVGLSDVAVTEDRSFRVPFTIVEESFVPLSFTFSTGSSNTAVVRTNDITFSGSDTNWTLLGTPVRDASGVSEITVTARNAFGDDAVGKFKVTVTAENDAPFITDVADQVIFAGTRTPPIEFNYGDAETEKKNLLFSIESSNARLVPTNNVYIVGSVLTVAPVGGLSGSADITMTVTDAQGTSASTTFSVRVLPALNPQFAFPNRITIRDNQTADPYTNASVTVSGLSTNIARVTVTLAEVNHNYPADIDILLVSPSGKKVVLMSDAGGSGKLENTRIVFDDNATGQIPFNPTSPIDSGSYKPTNHEGSETFTPPAPAGPYAATLAEFRGTDPNGVWNLYVLDDAQPDAGYIAGGFILNIFTTDSTILQIADQATDENIPLNVPFRVEDADTAATNLVTRASTDAPDLLGLEIIGNGNDRTLKITPVAFAFGSGNVTVTVTDGSSISSTTFAVTVRSVNQAPELTGLGDRITPVNVDPLLIPFVVFDRDDSLTGVTTLATLSKPSLGTLTVSGSSADRLISFKPSGEQGQGFVSVVASDGKASTTNTFSLVVGPPYVLTFSSIGDQTVDENGITGVNFSVGGSTSGNITVTGTSSITSVVDRVTVTGTGTNFVATIRPRANASGETVITLNAKDEIGGGTTSFKLTVLPLNGPTIQPIAPQRTPRNVAALVPLVVSDPDTALTSLLFTFATSDSNVVRTVIFGQSNGQIYADVRPVRDVLGEATVTIFVDDGRTKVGQAFILTVFEPPNLPPVFGPIPDQTTTANTPAVVTLNLTDPDTALSDIVYGFRTSNPGLVSSVTVDTTTGSAVATVHLVTDATGIATVTITANDGKNQVEQTFALSVTEADTEPPTLAQPTVAVVNGAVVITVTWDGGGTLEYATSPLGPWITTGNSSGSFSEPATGVQKYYQVKK